MRFTSTVRPLEGTIFVGTQLTPLGRDRRVQSLVQLDSHCDVQSRNGWRCSVILTTRAALSCDSHFRQNHGPVGT